jgi:hypothetical protein
MDHQKYVHISIILRHLNPSSKRKLRPSAPQPSVPDSGPTPLDLWTTCPRAAGGHHLEQGEFVNQVLPSFRQSISSWVLQIPSQPA